MCLVWNKCLIVPHPSWFLQKYLICYHWMYCFEFHLHIHFVFLLGLATNSSSQELTSIHFPPKIYEQTLLKSEAMPACKFWLNNKDSWSGWICSGPPPLSWCHYVHGNITIAILSCKAFPIEHVCVYPHVQIHKCRGFLCVCVDTCVYMCD